MRTNEGKMLDKKVCVQAQAHSHYQYLGTETELEMEMEPVTGHYAQMDQQLEQMLELEMELEQQLAEVKEPPTVRSSEKWILLTKLKTTKCTLVTSTW